MQFARLKSWIFLYIWIIEIFFLFIIRGEKGEKKRTLEHMISLRSFEVCEKVNKPFSRRSSFWSSDTLASRTSMMFQVSQYSWSNNFCHYCLFVITPTKDFFLSLSLTSAGLTFTTDGQSIRIYTYTAFRCLQHNFLCVQLQLLQKWQLTFLG